MDKLDDTLKRIRRSTSNYPPQTKREGDHVKVGGGEDRLEEDFRSSGTSSEGDDSVQEG